jgi:hypothetical protein
MTRFGAASDRKIWTMILFPFFPCNPLKSHKTAKGIFGKTWQIQAILWKNLQNPCAPRERRPSVEQPSSREKRGG